MNKADKRKAEIKALQEAHSLKMATGIIGKIFVKYQDAQLNDPDMLRPNAEKEAAMLFQALQTIAGKAVKNNHITMDQVQEHCKTLELAPGLVITFMSLLAHCNGMKVVFGGPGADQVQKQWDHISA
jgi:hypothetical protein